jgi:hypothetical protein
MNGSKHSRHETFHSRGAIEYAERAYSSDRDCISRGRTGQAHEFGYPGWAQRPGLTLNGGTAATPPPSLYMFDQFFTIKRT